MIEVTNLTKRFRDRTAVQDLSFTVEKGEIIGFLGPNGAGKSTTMRILTGFIPATSGTARVAGFDVFEETLEVKRRIGYLPENPPVYPDMTPRAYLAFVAGLKGLPRRTVKGEIERVAHATGIEGVLGRVTGNLSKGFRQRVGLAQALLGDPPVLILDEPTSGLDPKQIIETRNLIKSLGGEHTVVLSTHILPEVAATCSRIVIISNGRVVAEDTPENLDRRLKGAESIAVTVRGPREQVKTALKGVPRVLSVEVDGGDGHSANGLGSFTVQSEVGADIREALAKAVVSGGFGLMELRPAHLSLEEIFLQLTTSDTVDEAEAA